MSQIDIIIQFYLIIICIASTDDNKYMLKYFTYGILNSFDFYNRYETYILRGEIKSPYKSLNFKIDSSINITDIRYLYSNIEYNFPEDMSKDLFKNINAKYTNDNLHDFTFTASNSLSTKYLYLLISISPSPPTDITVYVKSNYNSNTDSESSTPSYFFWLSILLTILLVILIGWTIIYIYKNDGVSGCITAIIQLFVAFLNK